MSNNSFVFFSLLFVWKVFNLRAPRRCSRASDTAIKFLLFSLSFHRSPERTELNGVETDRTGRERKGLSFFFWSNALDALGSGLWPGHAIRQSVGGLAGAIKGVYIHNTRAHTFCKTCKYVACVYTALSVTSCNQIRCIFGSHLLRQSSLIYGCVLVMEQLKNR